MMKKIGIITHYYDSLNYGGNLQAYALCKYLMKHEVDVEHISFSFSQSAENGKRSLKNRLLNLIFKKNINSLREIRTSAFHNFNKVLIPHSETVYTDENINDCTEDYQIFITGSDQVWNLNWYRKAYFLDFVPDTKFKFSYAASISMDTLSEEQKKIFANSLQSYKAISVREGKAVELLNDLVEQEVSLVLDPTFLLEDEDWNEVCEKRIVLEKYIIAYFLGYNETAKDLAQNFAKLYNTKLVFIPYASGSWNRRERLIGDIQIMDASPEKFLSLIKHAEYVFTDSFHAVVFSTIFKKQFFVFNRDAKGSMNSRITSLTEMFDLQERFCDTSKKETIEYIESLKKIDYTQDFPKFKECREKSYEFIRKNIIEIQN